MARARTRETVIVRIEALRRHARTLEGVAGRERVRGEARQVLDTLGEAEAWLRGQPSPEVVTHIARMVAEAGQRLYALGARIS